MEDIITDFIGITRIREYYEQLYIHKVNNLTEMDRFLEKHKLSKLTQHETGNLSNPVTI